LLKVPLHALTKSHDREDGQIILVSALTAIPGPIGGVVGWRIALRLQVSGGQLTGILPDGRRAAVERAADEDMPFGQHGTVVGVVVEDPELAPVPETAIDVNASLFDGRTGELMEPNCQVPIMLCDEEARLPAAAPDCELRYRWLNGDGMPSDARAPMLTALRRSWLTAAEPSVSDACAEVERQVNEGYPPFVLGLQRLLQAACLSPFRAGPIQWHCPQHRRPRLAYYLDPTVRRPAPARSRGNEMLLEWRCSCGAATGRSRAAGLCERCNSRILEHARDISAIPIRALPLPVPVLHPWRAPATAALLGFTCSELRAILQSFPQAYVFQLCETAAAAPFALCEQRITDSTHVDVQEELGEGLTMLRGLVDDASRADQQSPLLDALWLRFVPIFPEIHRLIGCPPGSDSTLSPLLLARYRRLRLAIHQVIRLWPEHPEGLRTAAWHSLQTAADAIFGGLDGNRAIEDGTLRALFSFTWPTVFPSSLTHTIPGQYRQSRHHGSSAVAPSVNPFGRIADVDRDTPGDVIPSTRDMLLKGERSLELKAPGRCLDVASEMAWHERWAYDHLLNNHLTQLAAIADAATYLDIPEAVWAEWHWPPQANRRLLGRLILRTMWHLLACTSTSPAALRRIIAGAKRLELPADERTAAGLLDARLQLCFPEQDVGTQMLRYCVARVLSGWTSCKRDVKTPLGALWNSRAQGDRVLPAAGSALWQLLPAFGALCDPVRWLATAQQQPPESELVRAYLRLEVEPVPDAWWDTEPDVDRQSAPMGQPSPTPSASAPPSAGSVLPPISATIPAGAGASIYTGSVIDWIHSALHPEAKEPS
jgi:hypothetical protein